MFCLFVEDVIGVDVVRAVYKKLVKEIIIYVPGINCIIMIVINVVFVHEK